VWSGTQCFKGVPVGFILSAGVRCVLESCRQPNELFGVCFCRTSRCWSTSIIPGISLPTSRRGRSCSRSAGGRPCSPSSSRATKGTGSPRPPEPAIGIPAALQSSLQRCDAEEGSETWAMLCYHRITAWSGLAGTSVGHLVQPPAKAGSPRAGCTGPRLCIAADRAWSLCRSSLRCANASGAFAFWFLPSDCHASQRHLKNTQQRKNPTPLASVKLHVAVTGRIGFLQRRK